MGILYLHNIFEFNNISLVYFYLSMIYLFEYSKYFKVYSNYKIDNVNDKMIKMINIVISFILLGGLFIKDVIPSLKLILLIIVFIFYNSLIYLLDFQKSLLISTLYYFFCFMSMKIFSFVLEIDMRKGSIEEIFLIVIYHVMVLTVFMLSMHVFLIPLINNRVLSEIIYPTDIRLLILYKMFIYNLICVMVLNLIFDCSPVINNMLFFKVFFLLEIVYIFCIIYFFNMRLVSVKFNRDKKEIFIDDVILSSSARYEDKKIKNMNERVRIYSSVMKTNIDEYDNEYVYRRVQDSLNNFYEEYHTQDEILNGMMSEKTMMCKELGIIFLLNVISIDTKGADKAKLKCYYAILSLMIDIFVVSLYEQRIENKYIILDVIKFGQELFLQINHNISLDRNIMYNKNEILKSNKYKYLDMIVRQNEGRMKVSINNDKMNLIIMCK